MVAAFKAAMVPVNTNYRYGGDELVYLFDNADAEAVVFHARFGDLLDGIRSRLDRVRRWYAVADETGDGPDWATPYEAAAGRDGAELDPAWVASRRRPPDHLHGRDHRHPEGCDVAAGRSPQRARRREQPVRRDPAGGLRRPSSPAVSTRPTPGPVMVVACPLMHGTGQFSAFVAMNLGGAVVTLESRRFDVEELFRTIERHRATNVVIVGQAFAQPMLEHLDADPGRYDLSSVAVISSSGVMWSQENCAGLLRHMPQAILFDSFGSSEAVGLGASVVDGRGVADHRGSSWSPRTTPCSPRTGTGWSRARVRSAWSRSAGFLPGRATTRTRPRPGGRSASWKDAAGASPATTPPSMPTARSTCSAEGSVCINSGGEKIFPEEVEEALKTHPGVARRGGRRTARSALRGDDLRGDRAGRRRGRRSRRAEGARLRPPRRLQGAARGGRRGLDPPRRQRQGRLQAAQGAGRRTSGTGLPRSSRPPRLDPPPSRTARLGKSPRRAASSPSAS